LIAQVLVTQLDMLPTRCIIILDNRLRVDYHK